MKHFKFLLYVLFLLASVQLYLMMIHFSWVQLMDLTSFIWMLAAFAFALTNYSLREHGWAVIDALGFSDAAHLQTRYPQSQAVIRNLGKQTLTAGLLGAATGMMQVLANLDEVQAFTKASALLLLTVLYPLLLRIFILYPLELSLHYHHEKGLEI